MQVSKGIRFFSLLLAALLEMTIPLVAEGENTRVLQPGQPAVPAAIEDVAWISGKWRGEGLGGVAEEIWSTPAAGAMMGMFRLTKGGAVKFYELITIAEEDGTVVMRLKHFGPDLVGWEDAGSAEAFRLIEIRPDEVLFDRITYRKSSEDSLRIFVRDQKDDGSFSELEFVLKRVQ